MNIQAILEQFVVNTKWFAMFVVAPVLGLTAAALIVFVFPRFRSELGRIITGFLALLVGLLMGLGLARYKQNLPPPDPEEDDQHATGQ